MPATLSDVLEFLKGADRVALNHVSKMVRLRWEIISAEAAVELKVGDAVTWVGQKGEYRGEITGFKRKWVLVSTTDRNPEERWKVSPTALKKI